MNSEVKREWVFDGTRGEFWTVLIIAAFYCFLLIRKSVHALDGVVTNTKVDLSSGHSVEAFFVLIVGFVGFFILTIAFRGFGTWFTVAFGVQAAEFAVKIVFGYLNVSGAYALGVLVLLDYVSTLLLFVAFLSYIAKRLRREPLHNAIDPNP